MSPKSYFRDRPVLLMLSINLFLAVATVLWVLFRLNPGRGSAYFVQYRAHVGINAFKAGSMTDMLAFVIFALLVVGINTFFSLKVYKIHRQLAMAVLGFEAVLLVLAVIVSNALLVLR